MCDIFLLKVITIFSIIVQFNAPIVLSKAEYNNLNRKEASFQYQQQQQQQQKGFLLQPHWVELSTFRKTDITRNNGIGHENRYSNIRNNQDSHFGNKIVPSISVENRALNGNGNLYHHHHPQPQALAQKQQQQQQQHQLEQQQKQHQQQQTLSQHQLRYDAPDDCHYRIIGDEEVSLVCNLRTINSEFDTTNFSVIPPEHTVALTIICNDEIMAESSLEPRSLAHLIRLKELNIEYCKISKFTRDILYGLGNLRNLTLRTNNIKWPSLNLGIEAISFSLTKNLERLDLSRNNIWSLPQYTFCNLNGLMFLNMSGNRLQDVTELGFRDNQKDNGNTIDNNVNIQLLLNNSNSISSKVNINISNNNNNTTITTTTTTVSTTITSNKTSNDNNNQNSKRTNINNTKISSNINTDSSNIGNNSLPVLQSLPSASAAATASSSLSLATSSKSSSNFYTSNFTNNNATNSSISKGSHSCSIDLEILDVSNNHFVLLPANGFGILRRLKHLKLNNNEISMIADKALNGLKNLQILDLNSNKIVALPSELFNDQIHTIQEVYLQNNSISVLSPKLFSNLDQLQALDLSFNQITSTWINKNTFTGLIRLVSLNLSHNKIMKLESEIFSDLYTLQILNLRYNQLENIIADTFKPMNNLHTLLLSHNKLKFLDPYAFNGLYVLSLLSLDNNEINSLHKDAFRNCSSLQDLNLNGNQLKNIPLAIHNMRLLRTIDLGENQINNLNEPGFKGLTNLYGLRLIGNQIENITLNTFKDLPSLQILNLARNHIDYIESGTFEITETIQAIRLDGNKLHDITNLFNNMPNLLWLNISDNKLEYFDFTQIPYSLQWLDLHNNYINELTWNDGILDEIDITNNSNNNDNKDNVVNMNNNKNSSNKGLLENSSLLITLSPIPINNDHHQINSIIASSSNLIQKNPQLSSSSSVKNYNSSSFHRANMRLQTLDASFNRLTRVTSKTIPDSIELLFLNDNLISYIEPHSFIHKVNLTRVDLYANQITTLDIKALRILPISEDHLLPEFYIGGNPFLCDCNIDWLQKINHLSITTNRQYPRIMDLDTIYCKLLNNRERTYIQLMNAEPKHFVCTYKTHCFALCHCCEFDACDCEMTCPNNCTCFHDQSWSTNVVECSNVNYKEMPTNIPMDTTEVYIDGNDLNELSGHSFIGRKNLLILYANNSNIQLIYNTTFTGLKRLIILHLEYNKLFRLYGNEFNNLENLHELYLNNNRITLIMNGTFSSLKKLEILRLDGNKLVHFEIWQLIINSNLIEINLSKNPWSCECSYMSRFRNYIEKNSDKIIDINQISCIYNNVTNILLKDKNGTKCTLRDGLTTYVRANEIENLLPLLLAATCAFIGFFGLIIGIFCYRHELNLWANTNCILNICFRSTNFIDHNMDKDKLYDAYLMYSLQDEHFVNQILANTLEGDIGCRLCLHYRDSNVNAYITDAIIECIDSSMQALIVLSKKFLYNEWTRFEYKSALHEIVKRRRRIVFILYGEIPQRDIDSDMRHYLKTNACIEWDDKKFWQKLRTALPHISTKNHCLANRSATVNIYARVHDYGPPPPLAPGGRTVANYPTATKRFELAGGAANVGNTGGGRNYATINNYGRTGGGNGGGNFNNAFDIIPTCKYATIDDNFTKNNLSIKGLERKHHEYAIPANCIARSSSNHSLFRNYVCTGITGGGGGVGIAVGGATTGNNCTGRGNENCDNCECCSSPSPPRLPGNDGCIGGMTAMMSKTDSSYPYIMSSNEYNNSLSPSSGCALTRSDSGSLNNSINGIPISVNDCIGGGVTDSLLKSQQHQQHQQQQHNHLHQQQHHHFHYHQQHPQQKQQQQHQTFYQQNGYSSCKFSDRSSSGDFNYSKECNCGKGATIISSSTMTTTAASTAITTPPVVTTMSSSTTTTDNMSPSSCNQYKSNTSISNNTERNMEDKLWA